MPTPKFRWPIPAAYIVQRAMARDELSWRKDEQALRHVPLYTREQVEKLLAKVGI